MGGNGDPKRTDKDQTRNGKEDQEGKSESKNDVEGTVEGKQTRI